MNENSLSERDASGKKVGVAVSSAMKFRATISILLFLTIKIDNEGREHRRRHFGLSAGDNNDECIFKKKVASDVRIRNFVKSKRRQRFEIH